MRMNVFSFIGSSVHFSCLSSSALVEHLLPLIARFPRYSKHQLNFSTVLLEIARSLKALLMCVDLRNYYLGSLEGKIVCILFRFVFFSGSKQVAVPHLCKAFLVHVALRNFYLSTLKVRLSVYFF